MCCRPRPSGQKTFAESMTQGRAMSLEQVLSAHDEGELDWELFSRVMKKREERDDQQGCDRAQRAVRCLACAESKGNCGCDRTSPPQLPCGNTRRPFAAL